MFLRRERKIKKERGKKGMIIRFADCILLRFAQKIEKNILGMLEMTI